MRHQPGRRAFSRPISASSGILPHQKREPVRSTAAPVSLPPFEVVAQVDLIVGRSLPQDGSGFVKRDRARPQPD
ncbi:hypothetical protein QV13_23030 [Mesorhizobium hungaricum]|uniref:Uncharacterized protein n=1 Tax=Mesorhizobium hungaricum TaxID=1566387 RepID=A0A1C2DCJ6_9HYPH|nr:hypothetical protein QV13_23030 [Mesorhizobium hungaricum]